MEVNKDEALRCIELSKKHFANGNIEKALKLAKKSISLFETPQGTSWLNELKEKEKSGAAPTNNTNNSTDGMRNRKKPENSNTNSGSTSEDDSGLPNRSYSKEQLNDIERIKNCKDYYELFGVKKDASENEIKKAYKKLALQFHPDKNSAPGASDAFKTIGHAFAVLNDPEKRKQYDLYGPEMGSRPAAASSSGPQNAYNQRYYYEDEISPEEIFRMMFGDFSFADAQLNRRRFYQRQQQQRQQQQQEGNGHSILYTLLQILPLIFLIFISIPSFGSREPGYSFVPSREYPKEIKTYNHKVPFYVNPREFHFDNSKQQIHFEDEVEVQFVKNLRRKCDLEMRKKQNRINNAKGLFYVDQKALDEANKMRLYSCERLRSFNFL